MFCSKLELMEKFKPVIQDLKVSKKNVNADSFFASSVDFDSDNELILDEVISRSCISEQVSGILYRYSNIIYFKEDSSFGMDSFVGFNETKNGVGFYGLIYYNGHDPDNYLAIVHDGSRFKTIWVYIEHEGSSVEDLVSLVDKYILA